jgi:predicted SAM-dependent methyltransferase
LASGTVDQLVAIHVIEHFYEWEAVDVLTEWRRVLKPQGTLILELPCMDKVLTYLARCVTEQAKPRAQMTWWALYGDPRYKSVEMTHKWGYSKEMIKEKVVAAGFDQVAVVKPRYHIPQRDMRVVAINPSTKE